MQFFQRLTFFLTFAWLFAFVSAVVPATTDVASPEIAESAFTNEYFDSLVDKSRQWLSRQMDKALDLKAISPENFVNDRERCKFEAMILQGHYAIPGEKRPNIDTAGIMENLQLLQKTETTKLPETIKMMVENERELAGESTDANYHKERAHSALFWETYAKFLGVDRLIEVLERDEL